MAAATVDRRRNKGFVETHREMIETAVRLISEKGAEALSMAAVARAMGINRTTVYYHFENREALLHGVANWAAGRLSGAMDIDSSRPDRIGFNSRFVLDNPELAKLWIDGCLTSTDIRESFPRWDVLVADLQRLFDESGTAVDAEVYCAMLLASSIIAPRIYRNGVRPDLPADVIAGKFLTELQRRMGADGVPVE